MKYKKLKMLLLEEKISQSKLARSLGISEKSLSLKMNGKIDFWLHEIIAICNTLKIEDPIVLIELFFK